MGAVCARACGGALLLTDSCCALCSVARSFLSFTAWPPFLCLVSGVPHRRFNTSCGNVSLLPATARPGCTIGFVLGVWRFETLISAFLSAGGHPDVAIRVTDVNASLPIYGATVDSSGAVHTSPDPSRFAFPSTSLCQNLHCEWGEGDSYVLAVL